VISEARTSREVRLDDEGEGEVVVEEGWLGEEEEGGLVLS